MRYATTCLFVNDVRQVMDFYRKAFGFEEKFYDQDYDFGILNAGGVELSIASHRAGRLMMPSGYAKNPSGQPEGVEIAFYSDHVAAAFDKALRAGAQSLASPSVTSWGQTVAYVRSVEGTIIGICSPLNVNKD